MLRKLCLAVSLTLFAASLPGCIFVTKRDNRHRGAHPASHRHDHCHQRGKHGKNRVCHAHPHGGGHH